MKRPNKRALLKAAKKRAKAAMSNRRHAKLRKNPPVNYRPATDAEILDMVKTQATMQLMTAFVQLIPFWFPKLGASMMQPGTVLSPEVDPDEKIQ